MASPQVENGYTRIANELLEALAKFRLSGNEYQVVLAIIRKTYGFGKKSDTISMGQISEVTGLKRQNVNRALKSLSSKLITGVIKTDYMGINNISINKDYSQWCNQERLQGGCNQKRLQGVIKGDYRSVIKDDSHKRKKETLTKEIRTPIPPKRGIVYTESFEDFWSVYPKKVGKDEAFKSWKKIKDKHPGAKVPMIIQAIKNQVESKHFAGQNGEDFIPNPSTWLNQGRWQDEIKREMTVMESMVRAGYINQSEIEDDNN
jgi:phage replication O-like protein O